MTLTNWIHNSGKVDSWKKGQLLLSILTLLGIVIVWRGYHFQVQVKVALVLAISFTLALALGSVTAAHHSRSSRWHRHDKILTPQHQQTTTTTTRH
jgi:hypothetical protein